MRGLRCVRRRGDGLRICGEIILIKVSSKKACFPVNDKVTKLGDSAKECEAGYRVMITNHNRDFMKQV